MILKYSQWEWKLKTCQERPVLVCGRFTKMFYKTVIFQKFFPPVFHVGLCSYEWKCIILTWSALHVIRYEKIYHKCLNLANVNGFYLWCIYSTCKGKCTLYIFEIPMLFYTLLLYVLIISPLTFWVSKPVS